MTVKLRSEITRIELDEATFKGTGTFIVPTYVNFLFGNNGTGKSTVAKAIQSGKGVTYAPGKTKDDYLALVYNQNFIDSNVQSYHNLAGVFTINEVNVKIQEQIDEKEKQMAEARKLSSDAAAEINKKKNCKDNLRKQLQNDCWDKTEEIRNEFIKTQEGKRGSKKAFTEEVNAHKPIDHDINNLRLMYNSAYSDEAKRYNRFSNVQNVSVLDDLDGSDILNVVIANAAQTEFASFLESIEATEWFRQAHENYHQKADGICPYCRRPLPDDFERMVIESFDDRYEKNLQRLNSFLQKYRETANGMYIPLSKFPADIYSAIDKNALKEKLNAVKSIIELNINLIKSKIENPTKAITLHSTAETIQRLKVFIDECNKLIDENNVVVDAGPKKKKECRDRVFELMAYRLADVFEAYDRSSKTLDEDIEKQNKIISDQNKIIGQLQSELTVLRGQTVETETAIKNINGMLRDAGFQGFEVRPRKEQNVKEDGTIEVLDTRPINYEVIRTETGKVAEDLSEGEKNFIAFLYFQQQVFGSTTVEADGRQKIVVIDDPVSSMDSSALFIIGEQVRKMVEICRNNADNRNAMVNGNSIKQIFVLTHNAYFHREVTYPHASRYEFVSFYLLKKTNNKSSIRLCDKPDPESPSERINDNPVKNSYTALWEEYKELKDSPSAAPLLNVIRRILEYYFLQICGYDGRQLRQVILEDHKSDYTSDEAGNEDYSRFSMATSMLSYIATSTYGVNDGLNYIDDVIDVSQCRNTFRMIFQHMGQEQHYKMMMGMK